MYVLCIIYVFVEIVSNRNIKAKNVINLKVISFVLFLFSLLAVLLRILADFISSTCVLSCDGALSACGRRQCSGGAGYRTPAAAIGAPTRSVIICAGLVVTNNSNNCNININNK